MGEGIDGCSERIIEKFLLAEFCHIYGGEKDFKCSARAADNR